MRNKFVFAWSGMALLATIIITTGGGVGADSSESNQNQHKFSDVFLVLKPGDQVSFSNRDGVTHKLVSATPGYELDIGELQPGASKLLAFDRKGVVDLGCSMHPEMQMTIFVRTPPKIPSGDIATTGTFRANINLLSAS